MSEDQKDNTGEFASVGAPSVKVLRSPESVAMDEAAPGKVHLRIAKPFLKADDKGLRALAYFETARAYAEIAKAAWFPKKWMRLSRRHYREALELYPFWGCATRNLTAILARAGEHSEARRMIFESLAFVKQELADGKRLGVGGARIVGDLYRNLIAICERRNRGPVDRVNQWAHIQRSKGEVKYLNDALALLENITDPRVAALCTTFREWKASDLAFIAASTQERDEWAKRGCKG